MPTVHLLIKGRVQGVFYRAAAKEAAEELGLKGWIKNTADGNVESMVSGDDQYLKKFTEWCRTGPERAFVTDVSISLYEEIEFTDFSIIR